MVTKRAQFRDFAQLEPLIACVRRSILRLRTHLRPHGTKDAKLLVVGPDARSRPGANSVGDRRRGRGGDDGGGWGAERRSEEGVAAGERRGREGG